MPSHCCHALVLAVVLTSVAVTPPALHAQVVGDKNQRKCIETIAKEGAKYVGAYLKERSKCADKNLKATGACDLAKRDAKLDKAATKLRASIDKKCGDQSKFPLPDLTLQLMGFPGKCQDTTGPPFTNDDLETCIFETHRDAAAALVDLQYGANGADAAFSFEDQGHDASTAKALGKCQKEIAKNAQKFVKTLLKEVQKCRNGLQAGKLSGFSAADCADNPVETKPKEKIAKTETKLRDKIAGKCTDALLALVDVCDLGGGAAPTEALATDCIVEAHRSACDNPDQGAPADLVDVEYRATAGCGDNITNDPALGGVGNFTLAAAPEECDGTDDDACPGLCGAPGSNFACLCTDIPRVRVVDRASISDDLGWQGLSHDQGVIERGGHLLDLYDCDGPGGPDTECTAGPSCDTAPHAPCVDDSDCPGACRKRPTANGPHCNADIQVPCTTNADCPGTGNFCRKSVASPPIPLTGGGISTCVVQILEEDITGTVDVSTGASAVRVHLKGVTYLGTTVNQPCPLCGGFCAHATADPGLRSPCTADSDCPASVTCVLDSVCSFGPDADQPCRPEPPYGGSKAGFGTTSIDCLPNSGQDISGGGLDVENDPQTTGTTVLLPSFACTAPGFGSNACIAGPDTGRTCSADSDCSGGGAGSCAPQCFCPAVGGTPTAPNACGAACRGGANGYATCLADSECPGGFCQSASCRLAQNVCVGGSSQGNACGADSECPGGTCGDLDSTQEGFCPAGPFDQTCSLTTFRSCANDLDCRPPSVGGTCVFCQGTSETCLTAPRGCFVNEGIVRSGAPGLPTRTRATIFCVPAVTGAGGAAVNAGAGFPGPGASQGEQDVFFTGF